jgi:cardiolipin synthase
MLLGTTNLNHRSLIHDLEVDTVIGEHDNKIKLAEHFQEECQRVAMLTVEDLKKEKILTRFVTSLFFIFRYWM